MSELLLSFTAPPSSQLIATRFTHRRLSTPISARLGIYDRSFKWTAGVQSLVTLLVKTAAWAKNQPITSTDQPCLEGRRPSMAASLNDALTKRPRWVGDVFGEVGGSPLLPELIGRWNPDFNTSPKAPVKLWVEPDVLATTNIRVHVDGREVDDPDWLFTLANDITSQWERVASPPSAAKESLSDTDAVTTCEIGTGPAGVRLNVGPKHTTIEIKIDRDFDTFSVEDEAELMKVIQSLLKTGREIPVKGKRRGSVILSLELTEEEYEKLRDEVSKDALTKYGVTEVRKTGARASESASGEPITNEAKSKKIVTPPLCLGEVGNNTNANQQFDPDSIPATQLRSSRIRSAFQNLIHGVRSPFVFMLLLGIVVIGLSISYNNPKKSTLFISNDSSKNSDISQLSNDEKLLDYEWIVGHGKLDHTNPIRTPITMTPTDTDAYLSLYENLHYHSYRIRATIQFDDTGELALGNQNIEKASIGVFWGHVKRTSDSQSVTIVGPEFEMGGANTITAGSCIRTSQYTINHGKKTTNSKYFDGGAFGDRARILPALRSSVTIDVTPSNVTVSPKWCSESISKNFKQSNIGHIGIFAIGGGVIIHEFSIEFSN